MRTWISVDVEADGPIPGQYSMIAVGAVAVQGTNLDQSFLGYLRPISDDWVPEALAVSGFTRPETERFADPRTTMWAFHSWVRRFEKPIFFADNNGFDWQFVNWYFWTYCKENPFGFSSQNLNSLYKGLMGNTFESFKHLRKTEHDHNPVNDARGNAEAFVYMRDEMGFKA